MKFMRNPTRANEGVRTLIESSLESLERREIKSTVGVGVGRELQLTRPPTKKSRTRAPKRHRRPPT